jgi:hypothetical protein
MGSTTTFYELHKTFFSLPLKFSIVGRSSIRGNSMVGDAGPYMDPPNHFNACI